MQNMAIVTLIILAVILMIFLGVFIADLIRNRKSETKYHKSEMIVAFTLLLPAVVLAFLFVILPIVFSLGYSFTDFDLLRPNNVSFVGFENFKLIIQEIKEKGEIYYSLRNTGIFVILVVPLQMTIALLLALFCNNKRN